MKTLSLWLVVVIGPSILWAETAPAPSPVMDPRGDPDRSEPPSPAVPQAGSFEPLHQPYLANLACYEPMYFLVGTHPEDSKFQISLKYRLLSEEGPLARRYPWTQGFHFGYTQTSFWDLRSDSKPFEDTSYKPELLFLSEHVPLGIPHARGSFLQWGLQHESNGRDGDASRSTNVLYIRPMAVFYDERTRLELLVAPRVWVYVMNDDETNPDLKDYRGYFDLEVKLGKVDGPVLGAHLRWAEEGASTQWDLTYPLHRSLGGSLDLYLHVQISDVLAESLLDYRERTQTLRIGVALVR